MVQLNMHPTTRLALCNAYLLLPISAQTKEKLKTSRPLNYGRSCVTCKVYFVTTDPTVYTCPWCSKPASRMDLLDSESSLEDAPLGMVTKEQW